MINASPLRYTALRSKGRFRSPLPPAFGGNIQQKLSYHNQRERALARAISNTSGPNTLEPDTLGKEIPLTDFDIAFESLELENIEEALQDPEIIAIAPVMPTKLNGPALQKIKTTFLPAPKDKNPPSPKSPIKRDKEPDKETNLLLERNSRPKAANSFGFTGSAGRSGINRSGINGLYNALYNQGAATWGIKAVKANSSRYTGEGISVAILDTGIDQEHEAFNGTHIEEVDFTGTGTGDQNGHGTHCAGTLFGKDVDGNRIGIAPGIDRALIGKVIGAKGGDSHMLYQGIEWALKSGAKVIALSLDFDFRGFVTALSKQGHQETAATAIALDAYRQNVTLFDTLMDLIADHNDYNGGAIIVAAAGNEELSESQFLLQAENLPCACLAPALPGVARDVISVGAVQLSTQIKSENKRAQSGNKLVLAGYSTNLPDIVAPGTAILSAKRGGGLMKMSGTSMASPHVAGIATLYWEEVSKMGLRVGLCCEAVKDKIASSATHQFFAHDTPAKNTAAKNTLDQNTDAGERKQHGPPGLAPLQLRYGVGLAQAPQ